MKFSNKFIAFVLIGATGFISFYMGRKTSSVSLPEETSIDLSSTALSSAVPSTLSANSSEMVLNNIIYNVKNKDQVPGMIAKIQDYAVKNPSDKTAQIYSALVTPLPLFKGIVYRLRMIVEPVDVAYIALIAELRAFKRNNDRRAAHIDALFDYFTEPNPEENVGGQIGYFKSAGQFQDYMALTVAPVVFKNAVNLAILADAADVNTPLFMYDSNLLFGLPNMLSNGPTIRWKKFMPGHLKSVVANLHLRLGMGYYFASYNFDKLPQFINSLTAKTLVSKRSVANLNIVANVFDLHMQSPKEFRDELGKSKYSTLLTLRDLAKGDSGYLKQAHYHIQRAINYRSKAFKDMEIYEKRANTNEYFVDPDFVTSRATLTSAILSKRYKLAQKEDVFTDRLTGDQFEVNIPALFDYKNPGIQDLKNLYADQFVPGDDKIGNNPKTFKWNYEYGKASRWPDPTFAGVLPNTKGPQQYREKLVSISRDASMSALSAWLRFFM